jgi:hypothetical protein
MSHLILYRLVLPLGACSGALFGDFLQDLACACVRNEREGIVNALVSPKPKPAVTLLVPR